MKVVGRGLPVYVVYVNFNNEFFKSQASPGTTGIDVNMVEYEFIYRSSSIGWESIPDADLLIV
ncbi:MAG: hypothetical protein HC836_38830 [Richelia sp. RM2_1_2]|nr:hypothetical protein [Richelia sp. RM2_1_2]